MNIKISIWNISYLFTESVNRYSAITVIELNKLHIKEIVYDTTSNSYIILLLWLLDLK